MGKRLTAEEAHAESARLLGIALTLLDDAGNHLASAYVAEAIHSITRLDAPPRALESGEDFAHYAPLWGELVDRRLSGA